MKLSEYLKKKKETPNAFAMRVGVPAIVVYRYLKDPPRVPRPDIMIAIYRATAGKVQPNDFYELPALNAKKTI